MAVSCMRNASGHNYRNSSLIVDVAMGQIPRSTERISSYELQLHTIQPHEITLQAIITVKPITMTIISVTLTSTVTF